MSPRGAGIRIASRRVVFALTSFSSRENRERAEREREHEKKEKSRRNRRRVPHNNRHAGKIFLRGVSFKKEKERKRGVLENSNIAFAKSTP